MLFCTLIGATNRYLMLHVGNTVNKQVILLQLINVDGGIGEDVAGIY